ncbi:MAG: hypothetical protein J6Y82_04175 [Bacteroidales bacterium]|nr:hypothetical protein [Bacteroidales bacterium]
MKHLITTALTAALLAGCAQTQNDNSMEQELTLTQEWDKVFAQSANVNRVSAMVDGGFATIEILCRSKQFEYVSVVTHGAKL